MKKIIFSLLAVALMVTSCDKDAVDGGDYSSINVAQEATEISATVDIDFQQRFDSFNDFMRGTIVLNSKPAASTGRITQGTNLQLIWFSDATDSYVHVRPGGLGIGCTDNIGPGVTTTYLEGYEYDSTAFTVVISAGGSSRTFAVPADLRPLYAATFTETDAAIFFANYDSVSDIWSFREGNTPTGTSFNFSCDTAGVWSDDGTGLWSNPDFGSYRLAPAPFPLVGKLATVVTEAEGVDGTLNYAASNVAAVRGAIEGSFGEE